MHDELAEARLSYAFRCTVPVVRVYVAQHTSITEGDRCVRALRCFNADSCGDCGGFDISSNGAQVIQSHVFIGSVDDMFCLIQHLTQLYVVHVPSLSKELM